MKLWVRAFRMRFVAKAPILWTGGHPVNVLRGGLGFALRDLVRCDAACRDGNACVRAGGAVCLYQRIFAPKTQGGPSGFAEPPRPFVLRGGFAAERTEAGREFTFDIHIFDRDPAISGVLMACIEEVARRGLGPGRGLAQLMETAPLIETELALASRGDLSGVLEVEFVTPTELKSEGQLLQFAPPFHVLVARVRDRLGALALQYGDLSDAFDYRGVIDRAKAVPMISSSVKRVGTRRTSSRTGLSQPLAGIVGTVVYDGAYGEALGMLEAAYWTGVGKNTLFGHGAIRCIARCSE